MMCTVFVVKNTRVMSGNSNTFGTVPLNKIKQNCAVVPTQKHNTDDD